MNAHIWNAGGKIKENEHCIKCNRSWKSVNIEMMDAYPDVPQWPKDLPEEAFLEMVIKQSEIIKEKAPCAIFDSEYKMEMLLK